MKMFNQHEHADRQGTAMTKVSSLEHLRPVERYFIKEVKKTGLEYEYDVMANELPWFRTLAYTELAHSFFIQSLSPVIRQRQMLEASQHDTENPKDYVKYFVDKVNNKTSNKYNELKNKKLESRSSLILPVGENKLKETVCLNKLRYIISSNGPDNVYLKPHPLTSHKLVGELRDELGADVVLDHDIDMYELLKDADIIHTSHRSESLLYAVALGKEVDCIDVYQKAHEGSFFSVSNLIFNCNNDIDKSQKLINTLFNSYKSGFINPEMDSNWKDKVDQHLEYIMDMREEYRYQYLWNKKGTMEKSKK